MTNAIMQYANGKEDVSPLPSIIPGGENFPPEVLYALAKDTKGKADNQLVNQNVIPKVHDYIVDNVPALNIKVSVPSALIIQTDTPVAVLGWMERVAKALPEKYNALIIPEIKTQGSSFCSLWVISQSAFEVVLRLYYDEYEHSIGFRTSILGCWSYELKSH